MALVTGANRGLGREIVKGLLEGGVSKVYAGARDESSLAGVIAFDPARVVPVRLDITDRARIGALPDIAPDVTLLINNAGIAEYGSALGAPLDMIDRALNVNLYGPLLMARALAPVIAANGGGAVLNVLSIVAFSSVPVMAVYSLSKAAARSVTQAMRSSLRPKGVTVHAAYPGVIDTDMAAQAILPKTSAQIVAAAILAGLEAGEEDILPDEMGAQVGNQFFASPKELERQFDDLLPQK